MWTIKNGAAVYVPVVAQRSALGYGHVADVVTLIQRNHGEAPCSR